MIYKVILAQKLGAELGMQGDPPIFNQKQSLACNCILINKSVFNIHLYIGVNV